MGHSQEGNAIAFGTGIEPILGRGREGGREGGREDVRGWRWATRRMKSDPRLLGGVIFFMRGGVHARQGGRGGSIPPLHIVCIDIQIGI